VTLRATEQPIDTGTAAGKAFLDMLGVFAEFETNLRKERQVKALPQQSYAACTRAGSRRSTQQSFVSSATGKGRGPAKIARRLGIGRASVYRVLGKKAA